MDELDKETAGVNMTPLVDVSLSLVLFFMVTMPLSIIYGIQVKHDALKKYGLTSPQENIVVHLSTKGVFIEDEKNKEQKVPYEVFGVVLRQMIQISVGKQVLFKVDRAIPHGQTVWALDLAKQNGADNISFLEGI
jgi:biopolymer transport protein ExbD